MADERKDGSNVLGEFLHELARQRPRRLTVNAVEQVPDGVLELIQTWLATPGYAVGRFGTVLAASRAAQSLNPAIRPSVNMFREVFLNAEIRGRYGDWEEYCGILVGGLRTLVNVDVGDPRLSELVDELSRESELFARLWSRQDASPPGSGTTVLIHPTAGRLVLNIDTFPLPRASGVTLVVYHAAPGSDLAQTLLELG